MTLRKVRFDLMRRRCSAGHLTQAPSPAGVSGPVCYGPNVRAFAAHIAYRGHVSMERTAEMLAELFGCPVSAGFVASCLRRLSTRLAGFETDLKRALAAAPRLHHDETLVPVNGATGDVYTARTDNLIWYGAHQTRSHAAVDGFDILPIKSSTSPWTSTSGAGRAVTPAAACGVARYRGWLPGSPVTRCGVARSRRSAG